jgi:hypothetical protein
MSPRTLHSITPCIPLGTRHPSRVPDTERLRAGYQLGECLGFYRRTHAGEPAAVFLIVDNILQLRPQFHWLQFARDAMLGEVLYHEIGHHLHATVGSHAAGGETSADAWKRRLERLHFRRRYWYLRPLRGPALVLLRILRRRKAQRTA